MKLFDYWKSSSAWRVRIALHHKGLSFQQVPVDLTTGRQDQDAYRDLNPLSQVPLLELTHRDRTVRVTQSLAIIALLDQLHPTPALWPAEPVARAHALSLTEIVNAGIQPLQNRSVRLRIASFGGDGDGFARHYIARGLAALEALAVTTAGRYLVGDTVSVADTFLVPELFVARELGVPLDRHPTLLRVETECVRLDAFANAHPDRQPDAPTAPR